MTHPPTFPARSKILQPVAPSVRKQKSPPPPGLLRSIRNLTESGVLHSNKQAMETLASELYIQSHLHEKAGMGSLLGFVSQTASRSATKAVEQLIEKHEGYLQGETHKINRPFRPFSSKFYPHNRYTERQGMPPYPRDRTYE